MRRLIAVLMVLGLMFNVALAENDTESILLQCANEMAQIVTEKCSNEKIAALFSSSSEINSLVSSWGGDWACEENRMRATVAYIDDATVDLVFDALRVMDLIPEMSDGLTQSMKSFIVDIPASMLNAQISSMVSVASEIANCSMVKSLEGVESGVAFVLLDYGSEHPAMFVSFIVAENGAASVSAGVAMMTEEMRASIYEVTDNMPGPAMMLEMLKEEEFSDLPFDVSDLLAGVHISSY